MDTDQCEREMTLEEYINQLPTIHRVHKEYCALKQDANFLQRLMAAGVDNWDGYDVAMETE